MSLDYAILGFLQYKPLSGYDLKTVFDRSVRHFWPADQSQIYRTLSRLSERGWTKVEHVEQEDRPDRKVYYITDTGRDELLRWLVAPLPSGGERVAKLIQVFFAGHLTDEEIVALFESLAERCRESLAELRNIPEQTKECDDKEAAPARDAFFWMLTLEYGIRMTEMSLQWLEDVIARIKRGDHLKGPRADVICKPSTDN